MMGEIMADLKTKPFDLLPGRKTYKIFTAHWLNIKDDPAADKFIQTLIKENLLDKFRLWIYPVLLGNDKKLFEVATIALNLQLADTKSSTAGVIISTYLPGGNFKTGSFALKKQHLLNLPAAGVKDGKN
jgi:dihydrofolate reductase